MIGASRAQDVRQDQWTVATSQQTTTFIRPALTVRYIGIAPLLTVSLILKPGPLADDRFLAGYSQPESDPLPVWSITTPDRREPPQQRASIERTSIESPPPETLIAPLQALETGPEAPSWDDGENSGGVSIGLLTLLPPSHSESQSRRPPRKPEARS